MIIKLKRVVVFQTIIMVILLAALIICPYASKTKPKNQIPKECLLSSRVYAGLIEPKSLLITNFAPLKEKGQLS